MMRAMSTWLGLLAASLAGCGSSAPRARTASPGQRPPGRVLGVYATTKCVDRAGGSLPEPGAEVVLVEQEGSEPLLVDQRAGYRSVIASPFGIDGGHQVYQAVLAGEVLLDYRIPVGNGHAGSVALATSWTEADAGQIKRPNPAVEVCQLSPHAAAKTAGRALPAGARSSTKDER